MRLLNVMLVVAVVYLASAATTAEAQTINACVMKNGILKALDEGAECLPQETPISLGQSQPAVESVRVFDRDGNDIGAYVNTESGQWLTLLDELGVMVSIDSWTGILYVSPFDVIEYTLPDCQGRGYIGFPRTNEIFPNPLSEGSWLWASTGEIVREIRIQSVRNLGSGTCWPRETRQDLQDRVPVEEFTEDVDLNFPLPAPLWIGSSSSESP